MGFAELGHFPRSSVAGASAIGLKAWNCCLGFKILGLSGLGLLRKFSGVSQVLRVYEL